MTVGQRTLVEHPIIFVNCVMFFAALSDTGHFYFKR